MFQTLVLIPGQHGLFLEYNSREEAETVLRNVKAAKAQHNGGEVTAIPLNYNDPLDIKNRAHILLDLKNIPESQKQGFVEKVKKYISVEHSKFNEGQA